VIRDEHDGRRASTAVVIGLAMGLPVWGIVAALVWGWAR